MSFTVDRVSTIGMVIFLTVDGVSIIVTQVSVQVYRN